ncbi:MAG TPA: non-heme iron oxygenase ferredoxin subunit [Halobacteriales archaeon]|nr:non-heme iron oxygenase ferredoxin subunit [Halobacteriales archaeon]
MTEPVAVATTEELPPGEGIAVSVDGEGIAVFNVDGEYHAIANACTHAGGSLGNGRLAGTTVTCPLHGARFDVAAGDVLRPPADAPVRTYDVEVAGGEVRVFV